MIRYQKKIIRQTIEPYERIEVFKDNFIVTKIENTGAAYSLGSDLGPILKVLLLQIFPLVILLILVRQLLIRTNYSKGSIVGFAFIIGGGIGNLYDRIIYGSVTDFLILDIGVIKTEIFNLADVSIMLGAILVFILTLFGKNKIISKNKKLIE
ncbi:signal peptidase II [Aquimarina sp. I32.4]|uniref:signal peptidase II n=1 Tax=Aquimarina sp. I32.4 TaxID=2053903 RepID=UPI001E307805|nr:signal peptidase II [Aquimarina sp. I32.4]